MPTAPYAFPDLAGIRLVGCNLVPQASDTGNKANYTSAGVLDLTPAYFYDSIYDIGKNGAASRAWIRWLRPQIDAAKKIGANVIRLIYDPTVRAGTAGNNGPAVWRGSLTQTEFANQFTLIANYLAQNGMYFYPSGVEPWAGNNLTDTQLLDYVSEFVALATSNSYTNVIGVDVVQEHSRSTYCTTGSNLTTLMTTARAARVKSLPLTCSLPDYASWAAGFPRMDAAGCDFFDVHVYYYTGAVALEDAIASYSQALVIGETGCNVNGGYFENSARQETTKPYSSDRRVKHYRDVFASFQQRYDIQLVCQFGVTREWPNDNQDWGLYSDRQDGAFRFTEPRTELTAVFQTATKVPVAWDTVWSLPLSDVDTTYAAWANQNTYMLGWNQLDYSNRFTRSTNRVARAPGTFTKGVVSYFSTPALNQYAEVDFDASQAVASGGEIDWCVAVRHQAVNTTTLNDSNYYFANWVSGTPSDGELSIWSVVGVTFTKLTSTTVTPNLAHTYRLRLTATGASPTSLEAKLTNLTTSTVLATLTTTNSDASLQAIGLPGLPANVGTVYYSAVRYWSTQEPGATLPSAPTVTRTSGTALSVSWSAATGGSAPVSYIVETTAVDSYGFPSATSWTANASTSSTSDTVTGLTAFARYAVRVKVTDNAGEVRYSPWTYTEPITLPAVAGTANGSRVRG